MATLLASLYLVLLSSIAFALSDTTNIENPSQSTNTLESPFINDASKIPQIQMTKIRSAHVGPLSEFCSHIVLLALLQTTRCINAKLTFLVSSQAKALQSAVPYFLSSIHQNDPFRTISTKLASITNLPYNREMQQTEEITVENFPALAERTSFFIPLSF